MKLLSVSIAVACLCTFAFGQKGGDKETKFFASAQDKDLVIGFLKWSTVDTKSKKILTQGSRKIRLGDVSIKQTEGKMRSLEKFISLGNHFVLCLPESFDVHTVHPNGFALMVYKPNTDSFSFEWFNVDSPTHARKLREKGEIGFLLAKTPRGEELQRTTFLSSISMRTMDENFEKTHTFRWRTEIGKGSVINWPTVRNGKVVAK